ncbi:unnamed protein product [Pleuronectes platessa]|uniref:Uncharacterized protein n=1 Tax=Pleuronectes platessa TaxID=8262 RepID=A0A9N7YKI2_PLEPL|nr:unnamed protein product [Pleuronectes platessa]
MASETEDRERETKELHHRDTSAGNNRGHSQCSLLYGVEERTEGEAAETAGSAPRSLLDLSEYPGVGFELAKSYCGTSTPVSALITERSPDFLFGVLCVIGTFFSS